MVARRREETTCRFCGQELPDWKEVLRPPLVGPGPDGKKLQPTMSVTFNGKVGSCAWLPARLTQLLAAAGILTRCAGLPSPLHCSTACTPCLSSHPLQLWHAS